MLECRDIDALMMDFLYQELQQDQQGAFDAHLGDCARCQGELAMFQDTRAAVSAMPELEPPSSISAILLHEAAKAAPAPVRAAAVIPDDEEEPGGILGWLSRLLNPIALHPAATAFATLVLVAGVAGSFYIRGDHRVTTHQAESLAPEPVAAEAEMRGDMMRMPDDNAGKAAAAPAGQAGYAADLAPADDGIDSWNGAPNTELDRVDQKPAEAQVADLKKQISRSTEGLRANKPKPRPATTANAVSGADMLVDADDDGEVAGKLREKKTKADPKRVTKKGKLEQGAAPLPPKSPVVAPSSDPSPGRYRVYKEEERSKDADKSSAKNKKAESNLRWASDKQRQLDKAAALKRCRDAAKIANDILDRTPDYYYQRVDRSSSVKTCSGFVAAERSRRAKSRGKRRAAKPSKKKGASTPSKAKAAPAADEAAEPSK